MILAGRYEVVEAIKRGGMGAIYEGRDLRLGGSRCAIKAMLDVFRDGPDADIIRRKFQSETHILGNLQHSGIPRVRDYFDEGGTAYIVMDFVEGQNLEQEAGGKPMEPEAVVRAALDILDVLSYIHGLNPPVIHCDIRGGPGL